MPRYDFTSQRLFVNDDLAASIPLDLDRAQANYLLNVLRMGEGDHVLVFNGRDGEWRADVVPTGRKKAELAVIEQVRPQPSAPNLTYLFAPLKQARMEYMVQKAVEMGAGHVQPVLTEYTQMRRLNRDRMAAQCVEASEQCGILHIPTVGEERPLREALQQLPDDSLLVFCDEGEASQNPLEALHMAKHKRNAPLFVLVGPEGGFSEAERALLRDLPQTLAIPLGPRVLRADTAAVAALAVVQATLGDWRDGDD